MKGKTRTYEVTYIPSKKGFAVNLMKKGMSVQSKYKKNTSMVRASSPSSALRKLSARSYRQETGKKRKR